MVAFRFTQYNSFRLNDIFPLINAKVDQSESISQLPNGSHDFFSYFQDNLNCPHIFGAYYFCYRRCEMLSDWSTFTFIKGKISFSLKELYCVNLKATKRIVYELKKNFIFLFQSRFFAVYKMLQKKVFCYLWLYLYLLVYRSFRFFAKVLNNAFNRKLFHKCLIVWQMSNLSTRYI